MQPIIEIRHCQLDVQDNYKYFSLRLFANQWKLKHPNNFLPGPGSSPGRRHCIVFLDKTLYSHIASLHPGVKMGTGESNAGGTLKWTSIPSRGGGGEGEILLVALC